MKRFIKRILGIVTLKDIIEEESKIPELEPTIYTEGMLKFKKEFPFRMRALGATENEITNFLKSDVVVDALARKWGRDD